MAPNALLLACSSISTGDAMEAILTQMRPAKAEPQVQSKMMELCGVLADAFHPTFFAFDTSGGESALRNPFAKIDITFSAVQEVSHNILCGGMQLVNRLDCTHPRDFLWPFSPP